MCNKLLTERYGFFLFKYIFVSDLAVDIQFEMNYVTLYEMLFSNYVLELRRLEIERTINWRFRRILDKTKEITFR